MVKKIKFIEIDTIDSSFYYMSDHFISYESALLMDQMKCRWHTNYCYRKSKPKKKECNYVKYVSDYSPGNKEYIKAYTVEEASRWLLDCQEITIALSCILDDGSLDGDQWFATVNDNLLNMFIEGLDDPSHGYVICMRNAIQFALEYIAERGVYINKSK